MGSRLHLLSSTMVSSCLTLLLLLLILAPPIALGSRKSATLDARRWHLTTSQWESVSDIPNLNELEFRASTSFLLHMCENAYNYDYQATNLRMPLPQEPLDPILGWHLSDTVSPMAPSSQGAAGLHALVYEEDANPLHEDSSRVVLVFRGWQISSTTRSELADLCAGKLLFPRYVDFLSPPSPLCSSYFNESNLDYLSQAIAYTRTVLSVYEASSLLLTGHSFGAGLAVLVSAALQAELHESCSHHVDISEGIFTSHELHKVGELCRIALPVVSFSGPGTHAYLRQKGWKLYNKDSIISISHDWDFFGVRSKWRDHCGWLCLYAADEPDTCKDCFSEELRASSLESLRSRSLSFKSKAKKSQEADEDNPVNDSGNNGPMDDNDDDDDDDEDDDDCSCEYADEPCWECLTDTHAVESVITAADQSSKPTCEYLG